MRADSSPDNDGTDQHCQMVRVRQARRDGVRTGTSGRTPLKRIPPARTWRIWAGLPRASARHPSSGELLGWSMSPDGEATGKVCGVPVAMRQGHSPAPRPSNGWRVNVGTIPAVPSPVACQPIGGKDRRRPMPSGWGGGPAVVGGRESRPQGEGVQRTRNSSADREGCRCTSARRGLTSLGPNRGYSRCSESCTHGRSVIPTVGSMLSTTLSPTRPSSSWRGTGCAAIGVHARRASMASRRVGSRPPPWAGTRAACRRLVALSSRDRGGATSSVSCTRSTARMSLATFAATRFRQELVWRSRSQPSCTQRRGSGTFRTHRRWKGSQGPTSSARPAVWAGMGWVGAFCRRRSSQATRVEGGVQGSCEPP